MKAPVILLLLEKNVGGQGYGEIKNGGLNKAAVGGYESFAVLFHQFHLVNESGGSGELVDDEKHVADVHADAALQFGIKENIAAESLDITVESATDEFTLAVEHGASGVAAGDVVVGQEADGQFAVFHCILAEILVENELFELRMNVKFGIAGDFLLQDAFRSGVVEVFHTV